MKRNKQMLILGGILVVLCVAAFVISGINNKQEKIKNTDAVAVSFNVEDVTAVDWYYGVNKYAFTKDGDQWIYEKDSSFPVDEDVINDILETMSEYRASFIIEHPDSLSMYGLSSPVGGVNICCNDKTICVSFGDYSSMDEERYFSNGDGNVYLASKDIVSDLYMSENDFLKLDQVPEIGDFKELIVSGDSNVDIVYKENAGYCYSDNFKYYAKEADQYKPVDDDMAQLMISEIKNLSLSEFVTYNASKENLLAYNLDNPQLTINLVSESNKESHECIIYASKAQYEGEETCFIRLKDSEFVYKKEGTWLDTYLDLDYANIKPCAVANLEWDKLKSVSVDIDSQHFIFDCEYKDGGVEFKLNDQVVTLSSLTAKISSLETSEFTTEKKTKQLEIGFTFNLDSEKYNVHRVEFYRYNGDSCLAYVDGSPYGFVSRSDVIAIKEEINSVVL